MNTFLLDSFWRDVRGALRGYMRTPLFTVVVLITLALGIGANSAMFSLVDAVLLRPLPYQHPHQLVQIYQARRSTGQRGAVSPPNYFDLKDHSPAFEGLAAFWSPSINISDAAGEPEKLLAATCSYDLFTVLGVAPRFGRGFIPDDEAPGARRVAVLGYGLWQRRFAGDPQAVGRDVMLDGNPTLLVGVMPPGFDFPVAGTELWVPLRLSRTQPPNPAIAPEAYRQYRILNVIGRLHTGVSIEQARSQLTTLS